MTGISSAPHSYRDDPAVPGFDDTLPLFVFDGTCVLCSGGASWLMNRRAAWRIRFTPAAGDLGAALYRHYGMAIDDSYLYLADGRAYAMSEGYFRIADEMGGAWRLANLLRIVPRAVRDWMYRRIAENRYRWFGKVEACSLLSRDQRARLL